MYLRPVHLFQYAIYEEQKVLSFVERLSNEHQSETDWWIWYSFGGGICVKWEGCFSVGQESGIICQEFKKSSGSSAVKGGSIETFHAFPLKIAVRGTWARVRDLYQEFERHPEPSFLWVLALKHDNGKYLSMLAKVLFLFGMHQFECNLPPTKMML